MATTTNLTAGQKVKLEKLESDYKNYIEKHTELFQEVDALKDFYPKHLVTTQTTWKAKVEVEAAELRVAIEGNVGDFAAIAQKGADAKARATELKTRVVRALQEAADAKADAEKEAK